MSEMNRRSFILTATATAAIAKPALVLAQAPAAPAAPQGPFKQPALPFHESQLAPVIGARTVTLHYGKHHASYYTNLNTLTPNTPYASMNLEQIIVATKNDPDRRIFNN